MAALLQLAAATSTGTFLAAALLPKLLHWQLLLLVLQLLLRMHIICYSTVWCQSLYLLPADAAVLCLLQPCCCLLLALL